MSITRKDINSMIKSLSNNLQLKTQLDKELYLMEEYKELYSNYPFLLKKLTKVLNDKENLEMLFLLVDKMESINSGKEDKTKVEDELGQQLVDKYMNKN
ncbi:hypothetical protein crov443 [Cafeteria roenbergensis virus]|uniref:Uncharacterized protein n=1 Tax=Cafeteria roenbergensis virus (strain BV-PW1) TaxID=693272 RepID=E3T5L4_CROVB|nr:hypothetical protein crov443 [Cafeteria roenbergensis virus BV-PW1]ADO67477.1 hypothetical protein crov443 [Cafeteria roenbergensis virus BV-PW1]